MSDSGQAKLATLSRCEAKRPTGRLRGPAESELTAAIDILTLFNFLRNDVMLLSIYAACSLRISYQSQKIFNNLESVSSILMQLCGVT